MFRIIKFKSVNNKALNFITWKEKDHINQGGNTKIKPSHAFQCFSPGVEIRTLGKISAQPHTTLCIQFLNRENNDKNNALPLGKQICFTIVWGCAETLPNFKPVWD